MVAAAADLYQPFDAGAGANVTEDNWRKMARHWLESGVLSGEDNELQVYADSSGDQVKFKTGKGFVRGHYCEITAEKTVAVTPGHATLARIDIAVMRADFVNNKIEFDVVAGTASGSPAAPAVTQNSSIWEIKLAEISVPATDTTIDAAQVTDKRDDVWIFGSRNVAWRAWTPVWYGNNGVSAYTLGNGTLAGKWMRSGRRVRGQARLVLGSTTTFPTGGLAVSIPVSANLNPGDPVGGGRTLIYDNSATTRYFRNPVILATQQIVFYDEANVLTTTNGAPITLAQNDILVVNFDYEAVT